MIGLAAGNVELLAPVASNKEVVGSYTAVVATGSLMYSRTSNYDDLAILDCRNQNMDHIFYGNPDPENQPP